MRLHHRCGELFVVALPRGRRPSGERRIASVSVGASGESRHPATVAVRRALAQAHGHGGPEEVHDAGDLRETREVRGAP